MTHFRNISFIDYKELHSKYVKYDTDSHYEYYGNYTDYGIKYIRLKDFFSYMMGRGYIEPLVVG